jgi:hypothetical protein
LTQTGESQYPKAAFEIKAVSRVFTTSKHDSMTSKRLIVYFALEKPFLVVTAKFRFAATRTGVTALNYEKQRCIASQSRANKQRGHKNAWTPQGATPHRTHWLVASGRIGRERRHSYHG